MLSLWLFFYLAEVLQWSHELWWSFPFFTTGLLVVMCELFVWLYYVVNRMTR